MKQLLFTLLLFSLYGCNNEVVPKPLAPLSDTEDAITSKKDEKKSFALTPNQFKAVWEEVTSDPLNSLPQESVSYRKLFDGAIDLITRNAKEH